MNEIRKVSVVVPVFNEEGNVEPLVEEIAAVMNQQNPEWELWLVDDGSTDASLGRHGRRDRYSGCRPAERSGRYPDSA